MALKQTKGRVFFIFSLFINLGWGRVEYDIHAAAQGAEYLYPTRWNISVYDLSLTKVSAGTKERFGFRPRVFHAQMIVRKGNIRNISLDALTTGCFNFAVLMTSDRSDEWIWPIYSITNCDYYFKIFEGVYLDGYHGLHPFFSHGITEEVSLGLRFGSNFTFALSAYILGDAFWMGEKMFGLKFGLSKFSAL